MKPSDWLIASLLGLIFVSCGCREPAPRSTLIVKATVLDGTGSPPRSSSVRIVGETIAGVGELVPSTGDNVIDATGLTLAPGFIDTHSHADGDVFELPDALAAVSQGITTVVVGQDGTSGKRSTRRYRSGGRPAFRSKSRT